MRPSVIAFDVNETLSDLSPLGARFVEVGASASAAPLWFASVLRDGFALTAAGENPPFAGVARELLLTSLSEAQLNRSARGRRAARDGRVRRPRAARRRRQRHRPAPRGRLPAGHAQQRRRLGGRPAADRANVRDRFEHLLSVEDAGSWKPSARPYEYAAQVCEVKPEEMLLVAVHPWDVDGAGRAGLQTRLGEPVRRRRSPRRSGEPTYTVSGIEELAELWD